MRGGKTYRFRKASPSGRGVTEGDGEGMPLPGELSAKQTERANKNDEENSSPQKAPLA